MRPTPPRRNCFGFRAAAARERNLRVTTHVAESGQEFEMFTAARGEMFNWLQRNGRDMGDCGLGSPVQRVEWADLLGENLSPFMSTILRPETLNCWPAGRSASSIARGATNISSIQRFLSSNWSARARIFVWEPTALQPSAKAKRRKSSRTCLPKCRHSPPKTRASAGRHFANGHRQRRKGARLGRTNRRTFGKCLCRFDCPSVHWKKSGHFRRCGASCVNRFRQHD